ncbi:hypothetical protein [uncultured Arthrobacter sp.]|uniref:hypothetical protein n=1 Tax=uncultured Arthrobacter sp. TaxID=114050 RepID=UPI0028D0D4CA|nr:hypothetical protein [uncultured Arthrobacter sp.]
MSQTMDEISTSGTEGSLPLLSHERNWSPKALFFSSAQAAVATWCFIIGGYVAFYLPAAQRSVVMIAAMLAGMFLVFLATVPMATRYGLEAVRSTRPVFGTRGSLLLEGPECDGLRQHGRWNRRLLPPP